MFYMSIPIVLKGRDGDCRALSPDGRQSVAVHMGKTKEETKETTTPTAEETTITEDDDDWWQIKHGCGVGSQPLAVLLTTADRMADFRTGGYEDNLVKGSSWSVGVLLAPLDDHQLAAVTSLVERFDIEPSPDFSAK